MSSKDIAKLYLTSEPLTRDEAEVLFPGAPNAATNLNWKTHLTVLFAIADNGRLYCFVNGSPDADFTDTQNWVTWICWFWDGQHWIDIDYEKPAIAPEIEPG